MTVSAGTALLQRANGSDRDSRAYFKPLEPVKALLRSAIQQLGLSARAYDRLLKVARTIADFGSDPDIAPGNLAGAIQYWSLDRKSSPA